MYPQYVTENEKGTSDKSNRNTANLGMITIKLIEEQGYATKKDIINRYIKQYNSGQCTPTRQLAISNQHSRNSK